MRHRALLNQRIQRRQRSQEEITQRSTGFAIVRDHEDPENGEGYNSY